MSALTIREELHQFIDRADDRLINLMYAVMQADMSEIDYDLSPDHKKILDVRLAAHVSNPSAGSSWEEVQRRVKNQL